MPDGMEFTTILKWVHDAGFGTLLALILFGSYKEWWVWGREYRKKERECDEWKRFALEGTNLAKRALSLHSELP